MRSPGPISRVFVRWVVMLASVAINATIAIVAHGQTCADHGVSIGGYPSWPERTQLVLVNACRIAPDAYRNFFLPGADPAFVLNPATYPPVPPLQWAAGLGVSARVHCLDMAENGCVGHNDCDGMRTWAERIGYYNPGWQLLGENVAAGFADAVTAVGGLVADPHDGGPARDGDGFDGHRWNVMYAGYTHLGCGFIRDDASDYVRYYTQDFMRPGAMPPACAPIPSGSHIFLYGVAFYLCTWYSDAPPASIVCVIDGRAFPMQAWLGSAAKGTYMAADALAGRCRGYHFEAIGGDGAAWRYPARGELRTVGDGPCGECPADYDGSGAIGMGDIFAFLNGWLAGDPRADFNADESLAPQDVFDFLRGWFEGC